VIRSKLCLFVITMLFACPSFAAKPTSIKYVEEIITNGNNIYIHYKVKCSDGKRVDISGWNDGKKWCIGRGKQNTCAKTRVKIARRACK
jgi:hypothetical protein